MSAALAFLTVLGGRRGGREGAGTPDARSVPWFPVVGLLVGLALGGTWWGAQQIWPRAVAAAIVVAADLAVTGLLHLDGLADAADGLLPPMERSRRLAVMRDPGTGAFGVGAAGAVLLLRWSALASMNARPLLIGALWCASRAAMAATIGSVRYARSEGLASAFGGGRCRAGVGWAGLALAGAVGLGALSSVPAGPVAVVAGLAAFAAVVALAVRRVGGYTGDVLGAAGLVGETIGLVVASAGW